MMIRTLDFHQPREQTRFRAGYSTIEHLQVVNQLQEKDNEYNIPLCLAFVDYEKAFDNTEFKLFFEGLKNQGVDETYLNMLRNFNTEASSVLRLHKNSEKFKLGRGARERDNISPKLFMSCLPHAIINKINRENKGIINLTVNTYSTLFLRMIQSSQPTLPQSYRKCSKISMTSTNRQAFMHLGKTKVMCNKHVNKNDLIVHRKKIEEVQRCVYLAQMMTKDHDQIQEMKMRIGQGCSVLCKLNNIT